MEAGSVKKAATSEISLHTAHDRMVIIAIMSSIRALRGKYAKQVLTRCEADGTMTPAIRKHILDGLNDYAREVEELLNTIFQ